MTEVTVTPELLAAVQAQLAAAQKPALTGWGQPTTIPTIQGVAIPIKVSTAKGEIRLYLQLPAECASNPDVLMQTLQALDAQYPLDFWQPKNSKWDNSGGSGWGRSGYSGWRR